MISYDGSQVLDRDLDAEPDREPAARPSPGKVSLTSRLFPRAGQVHRAAIEAAPAPAIDPHAPDPFAVHLIDRASSSPGAALPDPLRERLERSLDTDLSSVRVHTGGDSAESARAIAARAYTTVQDVHFAAGAYDPSSSAGQRLIAHEVAHTVQQRGAAPATQARLEISEPGDAHEVEAEAFADAFASGRAMPVRPVAGGVVARAVLQREPDPDAKKPAPLVQPNSPTGPATTSGDSAKDPAAGPPASPGGEKAKANEDPTEPDLSVFDGLSFHPFVLKQIGGKDNPKRAKDFLRGMRTQFNPDRCAEATKENFKAIDREILVHFSQIKPVGLPGFGPNTLMHEAAIAQLRKVAADMDAKGMTMPSTGVAQSIRGYVDDSAKGRGTSEHGTGYAIDFRAINNPQIGDKRKSQLMDMVIGDQTKGTSDHGKDHEAQLGDWTKRRKEVGDIAQLPDGDPKVIAYLDKVGAELQGAIGRLDKFKQSLGTTPNADGKPPLEVLGDLRQHYFLMRDKWKTDPKIRVEVEKGIKKQLETVFAPWLKLIDGRVGYLIIACDQLPVGAKLPSQGQLARDEAQLAALKAKLDKLIAKNGVWTDAQAIDASKARVAMEQLDLKLAAILGEVEIAREHGSHEAAEIKERIERLRLLTGANDEVKKLVELRRALTEDLAFVFGKQDAAVARDPSVSQLLDVGHTKPDAEATGKPQSAGFVVEFGKTMMRHGFDNGGAWGGASTDAMHFELVDALKPSFKSRGSTRKC